MTTTTPTTIRPTVADLPDGSDFFAAAARGAEPTALEEDAKHHDDGIPATTDPTTASVARVAEYVDQQKAAGTWPDFTETAEPAPKPTFTDSLRLLADLLAANPDLPDPTIGSNNRVDFNVFGSGSDIAERVAAIARMIPGTLSKNDPAKSEYHADYYILTGDKKVGLFTIRIFSLRNNVCNRVQTGEREVHHARVAAVKAIPAYTEMVPVYEVDCSPLLAKAVSE